VISKLSAPWPGNLQNGPIGAELSVTLARRNSSQPRAIRSLKQPGKPAAWQRFEVHNPAPVKPAGWSIPAQTTRPRAHRGDTDSPCIRGVGQCSHAWGMAGV